MIATATLPPTHESLIPQGRIGGGDISTIGDIPVLTVYAQEMLNKANQYMADMALLAADPPETQDDDAENTTPEETGEDPAHHNGSPAGYPDGT